MNATHLVLRFVSVNGIGAAELPVVFEWRLARGGDLLNFRILYLQQSKGL